MLEEKKRFLILIYCCSVHDDDQENERRSENDLVSTAKNENRQRNRWENIDYDCFFFFRFISSMILFHFWSFRARLFSLAHAIQTLLHIIQMAISYLLMLVAMTYNTYLFIGVVLGAGFGHFLFAWRRSSVIDYNEHCH